MFKRSSSGGWYMITNQGNDYKNIMEFMRQGELWMLVYEATFYGKELVSKTHVNVPFRSGPIYDQLNAIDQT